jgi:hypothetical protein
MQGGKPDRRSASCCTETKSALLGSELHRQTQVGPGSGWPRSVFPNRGLLP